uniref:UVR domain-containing protein n=1 Tax=Leersia perrieri TaxID=77586 RepID=A0A0D9VLZ6_9ORYZ
MAAPNPSATMAAAAAAPARAWWRTAAPSTASTAAASCFRAGAKSLTGLQMTSTRANKVMTVHVKSGEAEGIPSTESITRDEETLQRDLETAIKEEDYAQAAKLRDELRVLQEDSRSAVLAANVRFYNAFKNGDLVAMHSTWAKGDHVYVVHPSAGRISGYDMVMQSWEMVCDADYEFPLQIDLQDVEVHVRGDLGYVTCLELVKTKGSSSWGKQVATNVFEKVDGKWFMCIHHASHFDE